MAWLSKGVEKDEAIPEGAWDDTKGFIIKKNAHQIENKQN